MSLTMLKVQIQAIFVSLIYVAQRKGPFFRKVCSNEMKSIFRLIKLLNSNSAIKRNLMLHAADNVRNI